MKNFDTKLLMHSVFETVMNDGRLKKRAHCPKRGSIAQQLTFSFGGTEAFTASMMAQNYSSVHKLHELL